MNLDYEVQVMEDIENVIKSTHLKSKLDQNKFIPPEELFTHEEEEHAHNEMQSLYLTEPLISKVNQNTRNKEFYPQADYFTK